MNFHNVSDAERALDTMNFSDINGRPCRIMWSQRDPSLRKTGLGNIFVRNLAPNVDNKALYDTFSVFGNILSCKVVTDDAGASKGYGYVHFETAEAATDAIQKFDGMLIEDMEVKVIPFIRKQDRTTANVWTNIYLKQFPTTWDEAKLREIFVPYGEVLSAFISRDAEGKSKGFAFVNLASHEAASKAVAELNNRVIEHEGESHTLYAGRAQKKNERQRELRAKQDTFNVDRINKSAGKNLYVKNVADNVTDEQFREAFAAFGHITSAKIMREKDSSVSKGFGFVCYESQDEATKAVNEMNNKTIFGKPLYVTYYQKKDQRRQQFAANYAPSNMRFGNNVPMPFMGMYGPQSGFPGANPRGMPYNNFNPRGAPRSQNAGFNPRGPAAGAPQGYFPPQMPPYMQQGALPRGGPRGAPNNNAYPPLQQQPGFNNRRPQQNIPPQNMPQIPRGVPGMPPQQRGAPMYAQVPPNQLMQFPNQPIQMQQMPRGVIPPQAGAPGVKFTAQARNQGGAPLPMPNMMGPGGAMPPMPPQQMDFSELLLNTADPQMQKNMIGEKLYPMIHAKQPEQAGKITGMLLEMDNGELLNLIESPDALQSKIDEALQVLRNHKPQGI